MSGMGLLTWVGLWNTDIEVSTDTVLALRFTLTEAYLEFSMSRGGTDDGTQPTNMRRRDDRASGAIRKVSKVPLSHFL